MGKYHNIGKVTQISIGILLLYMAFNSSSNIQSEILADDGFGQLGFFILAVVYFFIGVGSIMSTAMINKFGTKATLILGGVGITCWILSTLLAVYSHQLDEIGIGDAFIYTGLFLASVVNGFTVGILWSSANQYIADCSSEENKGFFFSYFWSFYMTSQIAGNLTAAFVLGRLDQTTYFQIMAGISTVGTISFIFIRKPIIFSHNCVLPQKSEDLSGNIQSDLQVQQSSDSISTDASNHPEDQLQSFRQDIRGVLSLLVSKRMRPLLPQISWTGISIAVYTGLLVPIINSTVPDKTSAEQFELSMMAMVALGVGEIVGALGIGYVVDKIGAWKTSFFNIVFIALQTVAVLVFLIINEYSWLAFFMAFLWGVQDSSISIHLDAILAGEFETNKEPFACDVLVEAITAFTFEIISSFMITRTLRIIYIIVVGTIGVLAASSTLMFKFKPKKERLVMFDSDDNQKVNLGVLKNPNNYLINEDTTANESLIEEEL